jgi:hypothetical protein
MIRALLILNDAPLMSVIMYILLNKWSGKKQCSKIISQFIRKDGKTHGFGRWSEPQVFICQVD